jgi:hypothetical protein
MLLEYTLNDPLCQPVAQHYRQWFGFMERHVEFRMADSAWHGMDHCARVLLMALIIGQQKGVDTEGIETLCLASVFHDSRRQDDWIDRGHGKRAADYYRSFCRERDMTVDEHAGFIMHHHDLEDAIGLAEIEKLAADRERRLMLFRIFKDADALDRFRLGPDALDVSMLRTGEAPALTAFSKYLLQQSKKELDASRPQARREMEIDVP